MPQRVRRFGAVWFSILISSLGAAAQTQPPPSTPNPTPVPTATVAPTVVQIANAPTSAEVMRDRIKKAKALVAVKNYNAAIYELEGIRKESNEPAVASVVQVMLMNCYLEQSDYRRAQALLTDVFNARKTNRFGGENYYLVAGQIVKGAKTQADRYKSLGLMVSDASLPPDAVADINKMRETVEMVITESKTLGSTTKETPNAMALLEEATTARTTLARDDFDAKRWKEEVADARDGIVNSKGVVDAAGDPSLQNTVASAAPTPTLTAPTENAAPVIIPAADKSTVAGNLNNTSAVLKSEPTAPTASAPKTDSPAISPAPKTELPTAKTVQPANTQQTVAEASNNAAKPASRARKIENKTETPASDSAASSSDNAAKSDAPLTVGASLIEYATAKVQPTYPAAAKTTRQTGTVRVDLVVDEDGKPEIQNTSGPGMLKQAALDAIKRWKFKPFTRDGQPVKASGYVSFNFNL